MYMSKEISISELRGHLADAINAAARGETVYITSRGRRVAAVVSVGKAEEAEAHG